MGREPLAVEVDVVRISSDEEGDKRLLPGAAAGDDPIALELLDRADLIQQGLEGRAPAPRTRRSTGV